MLEETMSECFALHKYLNSYYLQYKHFPKTSLVFWDFWICCPIFLETTDLHVFFMKMYFSDVFNHTCNLFPILFLPGHIMVGQFFLNDGKAVFKSTMHNFTTLMKNKNIYVR